MLTFANLEDSGLTTSIITLVLVFILTLTSLLLNPIVFLYNYKRRSIPGRLYTILSTFDIIASILTFTIIIYYASTFDINSCPWFCSATTIQKIISVISYTLMNFVGEVTATISIVRCFQVVFPFYQIRFRWIVMWLGGVLVYEIINHSINVFVSSTGDIFFFHLFSMQGLVIILSLGISITKNFSIYLCRFIHVCW